MDLHLQQILSGGNGPTAYHPDPVPATFPPDQLKISSVL